MNNKKCISLTSCSQGGYTLKINDSEIHLEHAMLDQILDQIKLAQRYPNKNLAPVKQFIKKVV